MKTEDIKNELEKKGFKKIKRTRKTKQNNTWVREYSTSTDNLIVISDIDDNVILEIKNINGDIIMENVKPVCTTTSVSVAKDLRNINWEITQKDLDSIIEHYGRARYFNNIKVSDYKHIGFIYNIDEEPEFLILSNNMTDFSIVQFSYGFTEEVKSNKFIPAPKNLKCYKFEPEEEENGQKWTIPQGYLCLNFYPEYMNFVSVSPCLKYGLASAGTVESDTFTLKKDINSLFGVNMMDEDWSDSYEPETLRILKKYDILNFSN